MIWLQTTKMKIENIDFKTIPKIFCTKQFQKVFCTKKIISAKIIKKILLPKNWETKPKIEENLHTTPTPPVNTIPAMTIQQIIKRSELMGILWQPINFSGILLYKQSDYMIILYHSSQGTHGCGLRI